MQQQKNCSAVLPASTEPERVVRHPWPMPKQAVHGPLPPPLAPRSTCSSKHPLILHKRAWHRKKEACRERQRSAGLAHASSVPSSGCIRLRGSPFHRCHFISPRWLSSHCRSGHALCPLLCRLRSHNLPGPVARLSWWLFECSGEPRLLPDMRQVVSDQGTAVALTGFSTHIHAYTHPRTHAPTRALPFRAAGWGVENATLSFRLFQVWLFAICSGMGRPLF
ncbi:hypothetical protein F5144DRAFT_201185 [Chaetomium tenue]|uniref:Uncharacterized protein n=1 Tax=Chaetomium tenue TaxID=1854479 RepID=A0ACB7PCL4_9PEZI|nr:hypothetical protein F5144DRAFT_201185 [Chaetomium globosum]